MKKNKGVFYDFAVLLMTAILIMVGGGKIAAQTGGGKENPASDFSYDLTADEQGILITGYTGSPGSVVIPAKIEDFPVLEIGDNAFDGKSFTWSVNIYSGTASTGTVANKNAGITSIIIPNTVRKIGISAFANTAITRFIMPDSVTEIAYEMGNSFIFNGCNQLTEIRFSDNLEVIPSLLGGFTGLPALKKVNLPKKLKMIAGYAFAGCGELNELIIPNELTTFEFVAYVQNYYGGDNPKYPTANDPRTGFDPAITNYDGYENQFTMFEGCGKLPIRTRQRLQELGYKGKF